MIGTTLQERYRLDAELGRGGMGVVNRAHNTFLDRDVAVKLVAAVGLGSEGRSRLLPVSHAAASLNQAHIVAAHDAGLAGEGAESRASAFIVMELTDGQPPSGYRVGGLDEALTIGRQIAAALKAAHGRSIIHQDSS
ncbi:MAG: hypothetical protein WA996_22855 [Candidatus Promineifilaceae bacterium]